MAGRASSARSARRAASCRAPRYQQRTLFDEVVRPLAAEPGTTAYFVVDALRFEMGEELFRQMEGTPATTATLRPRLAELPTVTEVGMNVLAPVARNGRLQISLAGDAGGVQGFQAGEFRVLDPETRRRAMHDRVGGATCPWLTLDEVVSRDVASLKRSVAQARLVVVHSREIDEAGEKGVGPAVFDLVLQKLRAAWRVLREAGVRRFVFTADHGFLLLDDDAGSRPGSRPPGRPAAAARLLAGGGRPRGRGPGRARGPQVRGHGHERHVPGDHGGLRHGPAGGGLRARRQQPAGARHPGAHRGAPHGGRRERRPVRRHRARPARASRACTASRPGSRSSRSSRWTSEARRRSSSRSASPTPTDVQVELCQARGRARIAGSTIVATVGEPFELFFRLSGATDARALVEIYHPSAVADVVPCVPDARFAVTATRTPAPTSARHPGAGAIRSAPAASSPAAGTRWLEQFPDPGVRQVFEHLAAHGAVTESEAAAMLGGPRGLRRFALQFEAYAQKAPFAVRIDVVAGVKRYVREGSG